MDKTSLSIKPNQPMNLSLENVSQLKNPRLFISLDSDDQPNVLRSSVSSTSIPSLEYEPQQQQHHHHQHSKQCTSCDALKRMLYLRDRTIMKLAEDRDLIKIKLTKAMNMNIELSRQLMKHQKINQSAAVTTAISNPVSPLRSKSPVNTQIREEVADLRRKCTELDEIYHHLKHHLFALRSVFADLGGTATATNDSGSGYHLEEEDIDDLSSINSSLSRASLPLKTLMNGNNKSTRGHLVLEDNRNLELEEEDVENQSADTDFHPLPPTRSALKNQRFSKVDNNNNSGQQKHQHLHQQEKLPTESAEAVQNKKNEVKSSVESIPSVDDKPQLSNFDIWYNS